MDKPVSHSQEAEAQLKRNYEQDFRPDHKYRKSLPDVQNTSSSNILGADVPIMQVGINRFRLPLQFATAASEKTTLEAAVSGTVSLGSNRKGINMSRIMRTFYEFKERLFGLEVLEEILLRYKKDLESSRARLKVAFEYPMIQRSLRSELEGYQYYRCAYEGTVDDLDRCRRFIHFDFIYSSACPCSADLAEHARDNRKIYSIPHSQRSKARLSVEIAPGSQLKIEELHEHCITALQTETQVMVKREDEQAFAELNGAYVKFVEDAARLLHERLNADTRICDFQVACAHLESLHSHDAVAVINKGVPGGFTADFDDFDSLVC